MMPEINETAEMTALMVTVCQRLLPFVKEQNEKFIELLISEQQPEKLAQQPIADSSQQPEISWGGGNFINFLEDVLSQGEVNICDITGLNVEELVKLFDMMNDKSQFSLGRDKFDKGCSGDGLGLESQYYANCIELLILIQVEYQGTNLQQIYDASDLFTHQQQFQNTFNNNRIEELNFYIQYIKDNTALSTEDRQAKLNCAYQILADLSGKDVQNQDDQTVNARTSSMSIRQRNLASSALIVDNEKILFENVDPEAKSLPQRLLIRAQCFLQDKPVPKNPLTTLGLFSDKLLLVKRAEELLATQQITDVAASDFFIIPQPRLSPSTADIELSNVASPRVLQRP